MFTVKRLSNKSLVKTASVLTIILASWHVNAFLIPTFDPANFIENLMRETGDLEKRLKDEIENQAKKQLKKELKNAITGNKSDNNSTKQVSEQKLEHNLRNHEVASQNTTTPGFCGANIRIGENGVEYTENNKESLLTFSYRSDLHCDNVADIKKEKQDEVIDIYLPKGNTGPSNTVQIEQDTKHLESLYKEEEVTGKISIDELLPDRMLGLTKEEYDHAAEKALIMFPPVRNANNQLELSDKGYIESMSKSMRSIIPYNIQIEKLTDKLMPNDLDYSERQSQEMFADDFIDPENIEQYTFRNMILPSQIEREKAIMSTFLVHMAIQRYRDSLNQELLLSIKLLEKLPD